jgi:hypothetical protein
MRVPCGDCGALIEARVGQALIGSELRWSQSLNCGSCGSNIEVDDTGLPPDPIREHLLTKSGCWRVVLTRKRQRMLAIKVLRALFGWEMKRAAEHLRGADQTVWRGTQSEAMWIAHHLEKGGVECFSAEAD